MKVSGVVKYWNADKRFGFIGRNADDDLTSKRSSDVYFCGAALDNSGIGTVREGDRVNFEITAASGGRTQAMAIEIVARATSGAA